MSPPGHCSTFRSDGGETQIGFPVRKENWLFPAGDIELSAPEQERDVAPALTGFMMGRAMDKDHNGKFIQAQRFWGNSIMHDICFLDRTA